MPNATAHAPDGGGSTVAAQQALELHDCALRDQIDFAESLKNHRKALSAFLALLVGLGIVRLDLHRSPDEVLAVPNGALLAIRILLTLGTIVLIIGAAYLFTERPILWGQRKTRRSNPGSGALGYLYLSKRDLAIIERLPPDLAIRARTRAIRRAYRELVPANRRVRARLVVSTFWLIGGMGLYGSGFLVYFWALKLNSLP